MKQSNKLTIPDLISTGVFTALYFVLVAIATFASAVVIPGLSYVLLPAISALISGTVYMLLIAKVQKFGAITIMGVVMGLFFFVSGHFILSFAANVVCGLAADLIAFGCRYRKKPMLLISYVVFSYGLTGPVLPLWFMREKYVEKLVGRGKDTAYIERVFAYINTGTFWICMAAILVAAVLGGLFGQKMVKKHFVKAGIV
ncbi:MAG: MptD family putative ECF transporter S component [Lachnospiraceae bacterium]